MGGETMCAHSWDSLAEHLGGRMASGGVRELSRFFFRGWPRGFLAWVAT